VCYLQSDAPRVNCPEHGPTVAQVPWARHGAGHTRDFDDQVAWLVTHTAKSAVSELLRVAWRTVGSPITRGGRRRPGRPRPLRRTDPQRDRRDQLQEGHKYLTVVVDHDTRRLIWAAVGRDKATLEQFFDPLGEQRCHLVKPLSADAAEWTATVDAARCPDATL